MENTEQKQHEVTERFDLIQRSNDWLEAKWRKLSASGGQPNALIVKGKTHPSGLGVGALTLAYKIAANHCEDIDFDNLGFISKDMERGNEWEKYALERYIKFV